MIREKGQPKEWIIDLTGPEGNAYVLLGYAETLGRNIGLPKQEIEMVKEEMTSGDYENLLNTFDRYFGDFVILER